ncbi:sporulation protein Cse60 [Streptococcus suis]|nr:sporulation protein Cse60 [Streptococcus suis]
MIKTKFLEETCNFVDSQSIDELINDFIQKNKHIEIVDIKFQSSLFYVQETDATAYYSSALILYKEGERG